MKPSTKDQVEGTLRKMKGKAKVVVGRVTDNPKVAAKGRVEEVAGTVQKKVGQVKKVFEK